MGPLTKEPSHAAGPYISKILGQRKKRQHTQQQGRNKPPLEATIGVDTWKACTKGFHGQNPRDDALIIAEEQTTEGRELSSILF